MNPEGAAVAIAMGATLPAGVFFPITWSVWCLRDEHPYRAARRV